MIDIKELYWVVGLFEGEGCFCLTRRGNNRCQIVVQIRSTDLDILKRVRRILGIGFISNPYLNPKVSKKHIYTYTIPDKKGAISTIMTMYPLLGERRQNKAREALALWQSTKDGR